MSVLNQISASTLLLALNTAGAATMIGGVSLFASRFRRVSAPIRHAVCVCGIIGTSMAPVLVPTLRAWTPADAELVINDRTVRYQGTSGATGAIADSAGEPDRRDDAFPRQQGSSTDRRMAAPHGGNAFLPRNIAEASGPAGSPLRSMTAPAAIESGNRSTEVRESGTLGNVTGHTISSMLFLVWLAGSFVFLLRRLAAEFRLRRWLATCVPVSDAETLRAIQLAATSVGLSEQPLPLQSATLPAPVVCGVLQPRLILPESMADDLSHEQHTAVLTHEMAHLARHDLATGLCLTAARIAYWWNPPVRMLCSRTEDLGEQVCDDIATANLQQPREYASALLGFAERTSSQAALPTGLGLSMSRISQLEIRIRRILQSTRATTLRVSAKACVVVALMTTVLAAAASMLQIRAASSTDDEPTAKTATTLSGAERPTLDELITRIEAFENAYLPFQLTVTETVRVDEELTPEQRNGIYYADGRMHQRLMEHGMLEPGVWFRSEASQIDGVRGHTHLSYADGSRNVQFRPDEAPVDVYIDDDSENLMWFAHNSPLMGVIPLSNRGDGNMFSVAVKSGQCTPTLTWAGDDAVLEFSLGEPNFQSSYQWTLSRRHDWHPIRLKTWLSRDEKRELISDWAATYLGRDSSGIWRVENGSVGNFIWEGKSPLVSVRGEPMPLHWTDFVVDSAAYGDAVDRAKFKYEIPENASIRMADKRKRMMPTVLKDRELQITVVDPKGEPIVGATVRTSLGEHELESLTTDASGQVVSKKRGEEVVFIGTEAPGYFRAELIADRRRGSAHGENHSRATDRTDDRGRGWSAGS